MQGVARGSKYHGVALPLYEAVENWVVHEFIVEVCAVFASWLSTNKNVEWMP
jgi:hypothetical protein